MTQLETMCGIHMGWEPIKSQAGAENSKVPIEDAFSMTGLLQHEVVGAVEMEQNEMSRFVVAWQSLVLLAGVHELIKRVLLCDIGCGLATLQLALDGV